MLTLNQISKILKEHGIPHEIMIGVNNLYVSITDENYVNKERQFYANITLTELKNWLGY